MSASSNDNAKLRHDTLIATIQKAVDDSRTPFILHYRKNYDVPALRPSWSIAECVTFGFWSRIFSALTESKLRRRIAGSLRVDQADVFANWLHCLSYLRNITYHHGRVLGTSLVFSLKPLLRRQLVFANNQTFYAYATVIHYLLTHTGMPTTWKADLEGLFARFPGIDPCELGFAPGWASSPGWG